MLENHTPLLPDTHRSLRVGWGIGIIMTVVGWVITWIAGPWFWAIGATIVGAVLILSGYFPHWFTRDRILKSIVIALCVVLALSTGWLIGRRSSPDQPPKIGHPPAPGPTGPEQPVEKNPERGQNKAHGNTGEVKKPKHDKPSEPTVPVPPTGATGGTSIVVQSFNQQGGQTAGIINNGPPPAKVTVTAGASNTPVSNMRATNALSHQAIQRGMSLYESVFNITISEGVIAVFEVEVTGSPSTVQAGMGKDGAFGQFGATIYQGGTALLQTENAHGVYVLTILSTQPEHPVLNPRCNGSKCN